MQRQLREDGATARSSAKERPERKQAACCQSAVLNFRQCGFETSPTQVQRAPAPRPLTSEACNAPRAPLVPSRWGAAACPGNRGFDPALSGRGPGSMRLRRRRPDLLGLIDAGPSCWTKHGIHVAAILQENRLSTISTSFHDMSQYEGPACPCR